MDKDPLASDKKNAPPRKVKFAPKAPPKREQKLVLPKVEKTEDDFDDIKAEQLLRRLHETSLTGRTKTERKVEQSQVAFGYRGENKPLKSYGAPKNINRNHGLSSTDGSQQQVLKEYVDPWSSHAYGPVVHPLRPPNSGNPELLDEEEFGEGQEALACDENEMNSAENLGLMDNSTEDEMIFLQLPTSLPITKAMMTKGEDSDAKSSKGSGKSLKLCTLEDLPAGLMGKMLVYKSGAIKLKLGDTLYDVSAGMDCGFAQDVVAINTETKQCFNLGEFNKRAVISPDIDSILDSISDNL